MRSVSNGAELQTKLHITIFLKQNLNFGSMSQYHKYCFVITPFFVFPLSKVVGSS